MHNSAKKFESFSDRLVNTREEANMTQEQLAEKSGVSLRSIAGYELGDTPKGPRLEQLEKLARALGVDPWWLLGRDVPKLPGQIRGESLPYGPTNWRDRALSAEKTLARLVSEMKRLVGEVEVPRRREVSSEPTSAVEAAAKRGGEAAANEVRAKREQ
jgi:transcriptional regulator with XRE-family HTH domain